MAVLKRRAVEEIAEEIVKVTTEEKVVEKKEYNYKQMISTGSTLLDLAISGGRSEIGGIPGGIIVEIFGPSGSGKTAILSEMSASTQKRNGEVIFLDPEARLDQEYARIYGMKLPEENYYRPDTVTEVFDLIGQWKPKDENAINLVATDSLAALSTELEMEKGDKMGMRRAKEFSQGLRKTARIIANKNWIIACSNQVREGDYGEVTPGGQAIPFYCSLRIRVSQVDKIKKATTMGKKVIEKVIGIESKCFIRKSSIDDPYRECPIYIVFNYGVDDLRGNLQYNKEMTGNTVYDCLDGKTYQAIDKAIAYVEENSLGNLVKKQTVEIWNEIERKFQFNRQAKQRI